MWYFGENWSGNDNIGGFVKVTSTGIHSAWDKFQTVNTDDYDIVPKKEKLERDLKAKEEEKRNLERQKEMQISYYDGKILDADNQIKELKKQLK